MACLGLLGSHSHLDQIRGLGYLAVPHISSIDGEKSVVRLDPPVAGSDGVLEYLHDEDAGLGAAAADADAEVLPGLPLQGDAQHVLGWGGVK